MEVNAHGVVAFHPEVAATPTLVAPLTEDQVPESFNLLRPQLHAIGCMRLFNSGFDFDSSFVSPQAEDSFTEFAALMQNTRRRSGGGRFPPCSVFGHADPTGDEAYNKTLSGRRALAIYAVLVRKPDIWHDLYDQPFGGDDWHWRSVQRILSGSLKPRAQPPEPPFYNGPVDGGKSEKTRSDTQAAVRAYQSARGEAPSGSLSTGERKALFGEYMDVLCHDRRGQPFVLDPHTDFLARGADAGLKGDVQGCGEVNPLLILSDESEALAKADDEARAERDAAYALDRRVVVYAFPVGFRVSPERWPCPRAKEPATACAVRFWSDDKARRSAAPNVDRHFGVEMQILSVDAKGNLQTRPVRETGATMSCRFYHGFAARSPCERKVNGDGLLFMQCFNGDGREVLSGRRYEITGPDEFSRSYSGVLDELGLLRHENVPPDDYRLKVEGATGDCPLVVLRMGDPVPQQQLMEDGRLAVFVVSADGEPIEDAQVTVDGLGELLTDDYGAAYFGSVPNNDYPFSVSKAGFLPQSASVVAFSIGGEAAGDLGPTVGEAPSTAKVDDARTNVTVKLTPVPPPTPVVKKITVVQLGSRSHRKPAAAPGQPSPAPAQLPDNTLTPSTSSSTDLGSNAPVVLLRNSDRLTLKAETLPAGGRVTWSVQPAVAGATIPGSDQTVDGDLLLSTDAVGAFSVKATSGPSVVIWNVVFVQVELDEGASTSTSRSDLFADLGLTLKTPEGQKSLGDGTGVATTTGGLTGAISGFFSFGKHAWSGEVKVKLTGGGPNGDLGCDKVHVEILQNVELDGVGGVYQTVITVLDNAFDLLDTSGGSPPGYDGPSIGVAGSIQAPVPQTPFLWTGGMLQRGTTTPRERTLKCGDSPAAGYKTLLSGSTEKLEKLQGTQTFRTALAAFSEESKNAVVVYADTRWRTDYTGDVTVSSSLVGEWSKGSGAGATVLSGWKKVFGSSSAAPGSPPAGVLMELFSPLAVTEHNKAIQGVVPLRTIPKPK